MKQLIISTIALIVALSLTSISAADLNQGLVHHWSFDGNANDTGSTGGGNGTLFGPTAAADRFGTANSAYHFDGSNGYIRLPSTCVESGLPMGTLSAWVRLDSTDPFGGIIFNRGIAAVDTSLALGLNPDGRLQGQLGHQTPPPSVGQVPFGQWVCVGMTWNGSSLSYFSYFTNGDRIETISFTGTARDIFPGTRRVDIGVDDQDFGWFHGTMDDLRIYDRVLSACEIQQLCEFSPPLLFSDNGHYYKVFTNRMSHAQAVEFARSQTYNCRPGHLATITSQAENDFVASLILGHHAWIGGFQDPNGAEPAEGWRWITGERFSRFTAWNFGEPNDGLPPGTHDVMQLYGRNSLFYGKWNDLSDTPEAADVFVVEFEPLEVSIEVSQVEVCWNSLANQMYQVEYRSDLTANQWTALGSPVAGTGVIMCVTDSTRPGPQRFHRVRELP